MLFKKKVHSQKNYIQKVKDDFVRHICRVEQGTLRFFDRNLTLQFT